MKPNQSTNYSKEQVTAFSVCLFYRGSVWYSRETGQEQITDLETKKKIAITNAFVCLPLNVCVL